MPKVIQLESDRTDPFVSKVFVLNCYITPSLFKKINSWDINKHGRLKVTQGGGRKESLKKKTKKTSVKVPVLPSIYVWRAKPVCGGQEGARPTVLLLISKAAPAFLRFVPQIKLNIDRKRNANAMLIKVHVAKVCRTHTVL